MFKNKITPNLNIRARMSWSISEILKPLKNLTVKCYQVKLCLKFFNLIIHSCLFFKQYVTYSYCSWPSFICLIAHYNIIQFYRWHWTSWHRSQKKWKEQWDYYRCCSGWCCSSCSFTHRHYHCLETTKGMVC